MPLAASLCLLGAAPRDEPVTPIPQPPAVPAAVLALGRSLFADPRLSGGSGGGNGVSCASCHDLGGNGAMGRVVVAGPGGRTLPFDTQTVFNSALSYRLNWEGNADTLERQAVTAIENPGIMGGTVDGAVARLAADPAVVGAFSAAYGRGPDRAGLLAALAAFERTLLTPGSRFDLWLEGDDAALSPDELAGWRTFKAVGCVSCHQGVNLGGNLMELHGIFRPFGGPAPALLRVPSLRNIAATAPYFHDGSAGTLTQAVQTMAAAQLGRDLTPEQLADIVAFLRTLTGRYEGRLVTAPPVAPPGP